MMEIRELSPENMNQAMQLVTESFDLDARRGWRDEDFRDDWMQAYEKVEFVAGGNPFVGLIGFQHYNQPMAFSLVVPSMAYGPGVGIWDWFFVSPRVKAKTTFPMRLAHATIVTAHERGALNLVAFVGYKNRPVERMMEIAGMKPVEVEYRAKVSEMNKRLIRPMAMEVNSNGRQKRN